MKNIILLTVFLQFFTAISQTSGTRTEIYFNFDSYVLNLDSKDRIDTEMAMFNITSKINIIGFTDTVGSVIYNQILSKKRCQAVECYLISKGIFKKNIINVIGKGERNEYKKLSKNRAVSLSSTQYLLMKSPPPVVKKEVITEVLKIESHLEKESLESEVNELKVGETLVIKDLNFIPGRHFLLPNSEPKIYELLKILTDNPNLKIDIHGHICCSPNGQDGYDVDTDSKLLSLNRAINIYEFLITNGIHKNRLSYKGFGPTKPLVEEIDETTRQMNRRVEIKIVGK